MDFPLSPLDLALRRHRGPVAVGLLVAALGVVVGGIALASALTTDTRDFAARHHSVLHTCAL